jgi:hypothetical protein
MSEPKQYKLRLSTEPLKRIVRELNFKEIKGSK